MPTFNCSKWDFRNTEVLPSGEVCVRQSFESLATGTFHGGFSVTDPKTNELYHYVVMTHSSNVVIRIYDAGWLIVSSFVTGTGIPPQDISYAIVGDEIVISGWGMPTMWGLIGAGLVPAVKKDSVNTTTTVIDIPVGICVGWAGRVVYTDGEAIYFSDALYPLSIIGYNVADPPGDRVLGLHVNAGGALVLVTSDGAWALSEDAAAAGQIVFGTWSKLSDYQAHQYRCSCVYAGRVYGLCEDGFKAIDQADGKAVSLSESVMQRTDGSRVHFDNYKHVAYLVAGPKGPMTTVDGYAHHSDMDHGHMSWWKTATTSRIIAVLRDQGGGPIFMARDRIYRPCGDTTTLESNPSAMVAGRVPVPPDTAPVLREVDLVTDSTAAFSMTVGGNTKSSTPAGVAPIVGTTAWGSGAYVDVPLRARRFLWAVRSHDVSMELVVKRYPARLPLQVSVRFAGPGSSKRNP